MSMLITNNELELVYSIIYSYWFFYNRVFLPHSIHIYTYKLVREDLVSDVWRDWFWTGMGPYSSKLSYQILLLKNNGLVRDVCIDKLCGLITISNNKLKPGKIYFTDVSKYVF